MLPQTLVSCLYDLEKRECIGRRPIDFYHRHAELTLGLDVPLVVYIDPEQAEWVRSLLTATDYFAEHPNRIQGNFALLPAFDPAVERFSR